MSDPERPAPSEGERQRTVDALCEAFADDRLTVEEFERRVEIAHGADSEVALSGLLVDLPSVHRQPVRRPDDAPGHDRPGTDTASPGSARVPARTVDDRDFSLPPMARSDEAGEHSLIMGIMGGGGRSGRWIPARNNMAVGIMGGVELDFRDAVFPPGVTRVRALAFWGGVDIIVPPGVRVECSGIGVMGGFDQKHTVPPTSNPDAPVLRITGLACMAGVVVSVRYPGESSREARKRLKAETRGKEPPRRLRG